MANSNNYNPLGTDGFEFVEYTAADEEGIEALKHLFSSLGFAEVAEHKSKRVWLYRQGDINFIVNAEPASQAEEFARLRGPSVCGMAFRVKDARAAIEHAKQHGGKEFHGNLGPMELNIPAIYGIGESTLYFVDLYGKHSIYDVDFRFYPDWQERMNSAGAGLKLVDHLTHNVKRGNMAVWAEFYENIGNFREIRYFDIEGKLTGLVSKAMTSPCGKIRIPINESVDDHSQIEEFIKAYNGEGIQHIALATDDIYRTVSDLKNRGLAFMDTPDTYYEAVTEGKAGLLELAAGGTLLLDEIADMSVHLQAKLLRVLEDGEFRRVGDVNPVAVDVRFICTTCQDLGQLVDEGKFRKELYYRLNVLGLVVPALRERRSDIVPLSESFILQHSAKLGRRPAKLSKSCVEFLQQYPWPGNVRQLQNALFRALSLLDGNEITKEDIQLPSCTPSMTYVDENFEGTLDEEVKKFERDLLRKLYPSYPSTRQLAKKLGLSHTAIANKLREYGINKATVKL